MTVDRVRSLIEEVQSAINAHNLDAFLACFNESYDSEQPAASAALLPWS